MGVTTTTTDGNMLHIYRVQNLNANCYGPVTAIEYCYRYNRNTDSGQATFNWTVLILQDAPGNNFTISSTYNIQSHGSMDNVNCTSSGDQVSCCDVTNIESFDLPVNFIFGVTESAQGNTHGATLLGYQESAHLHLRVSTIQVSKDSLSVSVGSTYTRPSTSGAMTLRGLRTIWFVIGEQQTRTCFMQFCIQLYYK